MEIQMQDYVDPKERRAYEPPRLVLPSEKDCAPEGGKAFTNIETTTLSTNGPS